MDSSIEIFEDIPKTVSVTENLMSNQDVYWSVFIRLVFQEDQDIPETQWFTIFYMLMSVVDEIARRKNRLRTTKKEDFL